MADEKRTIKDGYEVIHAVKLGGSEIIFAEKQGDAENPYMVSDCTWNSTLCYESHHNVVGGVDFLDIMKKFAHRISERVAELETERETRGIPVQTLTAADCESIKGVDFTNHVVVIKPESLSYEYRSIDHQLVLCTGGNGARPEAKGRGVFCQNLYDGKSERWERQNIAGIIPEDKLPEWAREKLAALRNPAEKESVLDQIKRDRESPAPEQKLKNTNQKHKNDPDL